MMLLRPHISAVLLVGASAAPAVVLTVALVMCVVTVLM